MAVEARRLTSADYAAFPDDGRRWELIDGEAFVTPSPDTRHQDIVLRLVFALETHVRHHRLAGSAYPKPEIFELGDRVGTPELPGFELDVAELLAG